MKQLISKNSLARRLGLPLRTCESRLRDFRVSPDAVLINSGSKPPTWAFDLDRFPALRVQLLCLDPKTKS